MLRARAEYDEQQKQEGGTVQHDQPRPVQPGDEKVTDVQMLAHLGSDVDYVRVAV